MGDFNGSSGRLENISHHTVMDYGLWYSMHYRVYSIHYKVYTILTYQFVLRYAAKGHVPTAGGWAPNAASAASAESRLRVQPLQPVQTV